MKPDSCQRGWRLFSIVAAYFVCSDTLKPYLFKYLETAAYDKRRAFHGKNLLNWDDLVSFWWIYPVSFVSTDIYFNFISYEDFYIIIHLKMNARYKA